MRKRMFLFGMVTASIAVAGPVFAQSWSSYDRSNSVAREKDFFVIRENGECAVKQSYHNSPSRMEIIYKKGGAPTLITPFSVKPDQVIFEVDPADITPKNQLSPNRIEFSNVLKLPKSIIEEMKSGRQLKVMAKVRGQWSHVQTFSLMGFTAATRHLDTDKCR